MLQDTIENLKVERKILDDLIARAEKLLDDISGTRCVVSFKGFDSPTTMPEPAPTTMPEPNPMKNFDEEYAAIQGLGTADAAARLIKGRHATTRAILAQLQLYGHKVGGKKPLVTLYSALTRSKVIRRFPDKKWGSLL